MFVWGIGKGQCHEMDLEMWRILFKPFCRPILQIFLEAGFAENSLVG